MIACHTTLVNPYEFLLTAATLLPEPYQDMCRIVIQEPAFQVAPGGANRHHRYKGGLMQHTAEVTCLVRKWTHGRDQVLLTTAAIFHDRNKIYEYRFEPDGTISKLPYHHLIRHVAGSFAYFTGLAAEYEIPEDEYAEIAHCILAHHGRREWGSPVEPATELAHLLHAADMQSMQAGSD